ncbi:hypothetical protein ACFQZX_04945 [Mucilaginibacter litoreus]|uniref:DUF3887 domain-containing protein n=1 Tax=Mucilaginibacter litoreus TaxID=1048221 RepID=A0ABW3APN7_9SPHI
MRRYALFIFFFTTYLSAKAQDSTFVKKLADKLAKATFSGDTKTVVNLTYPELVKLSGGKEAMQKLITERTEALKSRGVLKFDGWVNQPGPFYTAGNQVHCLVPETVVMFVFNGRYISHSYLLGVSDDQGKTWTFLDVGNMPGNVLKRLLPNFNPNLQIPPPTKPTFFPDSAPQIGG